MKGHFYSIIIGSMFCFLLSCSETNTPSKNLSKDSGLDTSQESWSDMGVTSEDPLKSSNPEGGATTGNLFYAPSGIVATDRYIVVVNSAFSYQSKQADYAQGFVTIIHRQSRKVVGQLFTSQLNPQRAVVQGNKVYIVSAGKIGMNDLGMAVAESDGALDILDLSGNIPTAMTTSILLGKGNEDFRIGAYSSVAISPDGSWAYLGSSTRGDVFKINLLKNKVERGPSSPIVLYPTNDGQNGYTITVGLGTQLAVLSFNTDELCLSSDWKNDLAQRNCEGVGVNGALNEGPIDAALSIDGRLLLLMSIANSLYRVDFSQSSYKIESKFAKTGMANNRVITHNGFAYIVNSMSNNIQRVDLSSGKADLPWAVLPVKANPYDMVITQESEGDLAWVTLQGTHQVVVIQLTTKEVIKYFSNE